MIDDVYPSRIRGARKSATLVALLMLVAAPIAAAALTPKTGAYASGAGQKHIGFDVVKQGGKYELAHFGIYCPSSSSNFGAIYLSKNPTISAAGKFSYTGQALHIAEGVPVGSATLKLSGKFVTAAKVVGNASFSKARLTGCPSRSFTATRSK